ncbi:MAG: LysR family transcriptional regulator [Gallionellales bacterium CG_4_9_14_0_8_um_filter_55_61]|nr:MAG: LysR family transcriptional regulator [Gallionellales bacterium CG_4_9_14_0_8_um_filter_55_61]
MKQINLSADDYILFATIVEQQSMVRAAGFLAMPKATVSRRLSNMESALGQKLLIRTTRRLTLTDFGQEFLEHCRRVAEEVAAAQDFVRSQEMLPHGRLRVSMPGDYARQHFSRAIATFIEAYPEIQLDVDLSSRHVDLIGEHFDLAIRMGDLADDATLVAKKIDEQHFALYASPIYLALHPEPRHPDELTHHSTVRLLSDRGSAVSWQLINGQLINGKSEWQGVPPGRLTLNSPDMIQQLLLDGAGIGALPCSFVTEDLRLKRLVRVLPDWSLPAVPAWAVMPMRRYLPTKTRALLEHLERYMQKG